MRAPIILLRILNPYPEFRRTSHLVAAKYAELSPAVPTIVINRDGRIVNGRHRLIAAEMLGRTEIEVIFV
jgi:ParB-like chromosome segregation protein Spo0J